ncbi:MAG: LPS assembly lipoprotein LptE [Gammaproteobacteria bacterium]
MKRYYKNKLFFLLISSLIMSLSSCGYHLRGSGGAGELDVKSVFLEVNSSPLIHAELREQLSVRDVAISNSPQNADRTIKLDNERYERRTLSVDEGTGKVTEFEIEYTVRLEILSADEKSLAAPQDIYLIRAITFDTNASLGKFDEEDLVRKDMLRSAANSILLRLQALK